MSESGTDREARQTFLDRLAEARARTDELLQSVRPDVYYERPIPERHRIIFYLGHFEAFDWNLVCRGALGLDPFNEEFDRLFAFGIDPTGEALPSDKPSDWPSQPETEAYVRRVRTRVDECVRQACFSDPRHPWLEDGLVFHVAIEHRLMHAETFAYMLHQMPLEKKIPLPSAPELPAPPVVPRVVEIPPGIATLGLEKNGQQAFGWDNEFRSHTMSVPGFAIYAYNVTNGEYLEFMRKGGYEDRAFWTEEDWTWKSSRGITHPSFWRRRSEQWYYRTMSAEIPLPLHWPVYVSHAEAAAYARWEGKSLPTEAQLHRAAYGTPEGHERRYPWGDEPPGWRRGNFDFQRWDPTAVGSHPAGQSAFAVADLVGNGWEWTDTLFEPFPGFQAFSLYPGYSANFFDGNHYVLKGGSARTAACMLRRSFRNWFQPHYPYIYATFRCVEN